MKATIQYKWFFGVQPFKTSILVIVLAIVFVNSNAVAQQTHTVSFQTSDGIYGHAVIKTAPRSMGTGYIVIDSQRLVYEGVRGSFKLSGITFPLTAQKYTIDLKGSGCMRLNSQTPDCGSFSMQYLGASTSDYTEAAFSESAKQKHNDIRRETGEEIWINRGFAQNIEITEVRGDDLNSIRKAINAASAETTESQEVIGNEQGSEEEAQQGTEEEQPIQQKTTSNQYQQNDGKNSDSYENGEEISIPAPVINPANKRIVDDEMLDFLNSTANDSENPRFKKMVEEFNSYRNTAAQQKMIIGSVAPLSQQDYDEYNMAENMAQAVSVGKFILGSIFSKEKNKEPTISPSQRKAESSISQLSKQLRELYDEIQTIPNYRSYDENTLASLDKIEAKIYKYERITAPSRLLYLKFTLSNQMLDMNDLNALSNSINNEMGQEGNKNLIDQIETIQHRYPEIENVPHMGNANFGFQENLNTIRVIRARCLRNIGRIAEAEKIEKDISYDVIPYNAVRLLYSAYSENNYYESIKLYQPVKRYFSEKMGSDFMYLELPHLTANYEGLYRTDATYLLGIGVLAHLYSGKFSQAWEEFLFLRDFQGVLEKKLEDNKKLPDRKKAYGPSDAEYEAYIRGSESIISTIESALLSKAGNHQQALEKINHALKLNNEGSSGVASAQKYEPWMLYQKTRVLVELGNFEAARESARLAKTENRSAIENFKIDFDSDELSFLMAFVRFKEKDYNGALLALKILERRNPKVAKYHLLEEDIHIEQGDQQKADAAKKQYIEKITSS
ncbi:MAG: hypothetical protein HUJ22_10035 [Gracilimonas sp.]|uniref:tetratricopeptide repeat protein n=1 Tax=Gracilimonas sp. TaxID=1974203 RepID=UPI0019939D86|nr:hypothetical protein [Gracilimonas sp.]MBD3616899.1 hypothetical protein [Gracilimonas sp.]